MKTKIDMSKIQKVKPFAISVALLTFLIYLPSLKNGFVNWDDDSYIYENFFIRDIGIKLFEWAFLRFNVANWHPLTWVSHSIDYAIWGLSPLGHHLTNNILHAINTFIVVLLVVRLLGIVRSRGMDKGHSESFLTERGMFITGVTTGLLFGVHPIHVESVAWVSERKDVLCALFFLLSILSYLRYVDITDKQKELTPRRFNKNYLLTLGLFILALLSKPMAVTLPVVLLILDWYPCQRLKGLKVYRGVLIEKLPFFVLSLGSSIITVLAQRSGKAVMSLEFAPLALRIIVGVKTFIAYLWKILLPLNLTPFYPYPRSGSFLSLKYLGPILLVIGITAFCIVVLKRQRLWLAVWSYYVITLLPVSGIIQVGFQSMADRYTYLPSLGPFFVIGLVVTLVYERVSTSEKWGLVFKVFSAAIVVVLMWLSIQQIGVWKDSLTLWNYVIKEKSVKNPVAYYHRGIAYYEDGKYDRAIEDYTTAIALNPDYFEAYNNRGVTHGRKGEYNRAIEDYDMAIALSQDFRVYNNRGNTYITKGLLERAIEDFNKAIAINPDSDEAYSSRGIACYLKGQYDKAFEDFKKAIELNQNNAEAYINLGYVYLQMGNRELAISDLQKGCNLGNKNGCKTLQNLLNNNLRQ